MQFLDTVKIGNKKHRHVQEIKTGKGVPTRIVANLGITPGATTKEEELEKASACDCAGADIIADHSFGVDVIDV